MRAFGVIALLISSVSAQDLRLDGELNEQAWRDAPVIQVKQPSHIHPNYRAGWTGPKDLSFRLRTLVVGTDLYLGIEVSDDIRMHAAGREFWAGDSIEVFLDTDLVSDEPGDRFTDDDRQLFLMPFHPSLRWGVIARGPSVPYPDGGLSGVVVAHTEHAGGYTVEAKIPLGRLGHLRPDENGRIGFDIAINDVDSPDATQAETYMTLSGRFELHNTPSNFTRLEIGPLPELSVRDERPPADWPALLLGLAGLAVVLLIARELGKRVARRRRIRTVPLAVALVAGATVLALLPSLIAWVDERSANRQAQPALGAARVVAQTYLDLDANPAGERLRSLFRDGRVTIRPRYRYDFLPLGPRDRFDLRYSIPLAPGETRVFPMAGIRAPDRLRVHVAQPAVGRRETAGVPAAEVRIEFFEGEPLHARGRTQISIDCGARAGRALRAVRIRNALSHQTLFVDALFGEESGVWRALPLASPSAAGVPLDIWHDTPASHIVTVAAGGTHSIDVSGLVGDRLWLALACEGAYPESDYGATVAEISVRYRDGAAGPTLSVRNGHDVADHRMVYARPDAVVAFTWEDRNRFPRHYTLHELPLDPGRPVAGIDVTDRGVLKALRVAAATMGRREVAAPPAASGLRLRGDTLQLRSKTRALFSGLGFSVRTGDGAPHTTGPVTGVRTRIPLGDDAGALDVWLPHNGWALALQRAEGAFFGIAVLLLAVAAVVLGAGLLQHARHLRVKMFVALGAATVVPLAFLFFSLSTLLNKQAEDMLEQATLADLRSLLDRIAGGKAKARTLASSARDRIEFVASRGPEALRHQARRSRENIVAQGGFLRMPELDPAGPSALGNASFVDALSRSGLYFSPWDGLFALGVARSPGQRRYFVGLRAETLLGPAPSDEVSFALYAPDGATLATTRGLSPPSRPGLRAALHRRVRPLYEQNLSSRAAAHVLLRERDRIVGMIGVYRSRAPTEAHKSETFRMLLLSGLASMLLVVLAGGTLVDRVASRLGRVTRTARAIAQGELDSRVPVEAEDEVGRLAISFNSMADALSERMQQLTELQRGLHELTAALDRTEVARAAADLLARATGARHVNIAAVDMATERMDTLHRLGEGAPLGVRIPREGPVRDAVIRQVPVQKEGAMFLPLVAAGRTVGLATCSPVDAEFDRNFLDLSGRQIGIALENARLYRAAVTDERTGLYTFSFFVRRLKEEVDRASASNRPLSLLRVVIDDYAAIARSRGTAAAARIVAETAATIGRVSPPRHMVAHRDAGELLVLLVESDAHGAAASRDTIAAALERRGLQATFRYRSVTHPRDGAAADILLDALFSVTETWEEIDAGQVPALRTPPHVELSRSPTMRAVYDVVARVAPTSATVLLGGETGTGKEVLADLIQANSDRCDGPYVKVNCAAIPETLIESELFGHERGAFTGADRRRIGRFEEAHRGTLFLDEIGELPLPMQSKLLRVLQERRFRRVGGSASIHTDVRILAASNRDLAEAVRQGLFREDLFHRLHVIELRVPPLRDHREDIPQLIQRFRAELNRLHRLEVESFSPDAMDALYRHDWPGNVRELKNTIERAVVIAGGPQVLRQHLSLLGEESAPIARIDDLTPRQERILSAAIENGGVTNSAVVKEEAVSPRTALRELQTLVGRGLLVRIGRRRGAVYRPPS